jgi:DNA-directed RNA polymerase specialized sigma24 family protein
MPDGFDGSERNAQFPTTSWTAIVNARDPSSAVSRDGLRRLCSNYWYPIFTFIRLKGLDSDGARDCTQDFFTAFLEKEYLADIERSKGRFRSFLLAAVNHFFANWLDAQRAQKRGGRCTFIPLDMQDVGADYRNKLAHALTPETLFEYHWAVNVLERTLTRLRVSYSDRDFKILKPFLIGEAAHGDGTAAAAQLGISEGAFKVSIHRLRKRYREMLRAEIAETVSDASQVEEEIRYLLRALARGEGRAV